MPTTTAKPFIKWVGGKRQLIPSLIAHLPADFGDWEAVTYIEPFVGGGAMLFDMLQRFPNIERAIINDINPKLVNVYRIVKEQPQALIAALQTIEAEYLSLGDEATRKSYYLAMRDRFNAPGHAPVEQAAQFIYLNRTCFNGLYRENSKGKFNVPFGRYTNPQICDADTILADSALLQHTEICCGDYAATARYISDKTFCYCDPPYRPLNATSNFNAYVKEPFNDDEQRRLKEYADLLTQSGVSVMLSNSDGHSYNADDTFFDELYADYHRHRVYATRCVNAAANKRGKLAELLITNYDAAGCNNISKLLSHPHTIPNHGTYRESV